MNKTVLILCCLVFLAFTAGAQNAGKKKNAPDEKITVKREFDKNGNLIRFDSLRVFSWSSDSAFHLPLQGGWEDFFGKDYFDHHFQDHFMGDSVFSFGFPSGPKPLRFLDEDDFFKGFGFGMQDSAFSKNFLFQNDTSFFMGPNSSLMLPPGFFSPDWKGVKDLEEFFGQHFKSLTPDQFYGNPGNDDSMEKFLNPQQKEEWEKMMKRQQKEQEEFFRKYNKQKPGRKTEKM
jgi:hypothetical protein